MKRFLLILAGLSLLAAGCARVRHKGVAPPVSSVSPASSSLTETKVSPTETEEAPAKASTPDFSSMSFTEKNDLYLQLLDEKRAAGVDTSEAEEAYLQSVKASFNGQSEEADEYIEQAILLLLDS